MPLLAKDIEALENTSFATAALGMAADAATHGPICIGDTEGLVCIGSIACVVSDGCSNGCIESVTCLPTVNNLTDLITNNITHLIPTVAGFSQSGCISDQGCMTYDCQEA